MSEPNKSSKSDGSAVGQSAGSSALAVSKSSSAAQTTENAIKARVAESQMPAPVKNRYVPGFRGSENNSGPNPYPADLDDDDLHTIGTIEPQSTEGGQSKKEIPSTLYYNRSTGQTMHWASKPNAKGWERVTGRSGGKEQNQEVSASAQDVEDVWTDTDSDQEDKSRLGKWLEDQ